MMKILRIIALFILPLFLISCFGSNPEDSVRNVLDAAESTNFSKMSAYLTGNTLRMLLVTGGRGIAFSRLCGRIRKIYAAYEIEDIYFLRARYYNAARNANISFLVRYSYKNINRFRQMTWRLRLIDGRWKIVSF